MPEDSLLSSADAIPEANRPLVETRLVAWHFVASIAFLLISMLGGILMALQLVNGNPLKGVEIFSPGRWRMVHTSTVAYGFLANAFLGCLYWAVPRLTLRPVLSRPLSYFIFAAWQIVVLMTAVGILAGYAQGIEWGETPVFVDPLALAGLFLVAVNFIAPIVRANGPRYVSLWYFMAAFVWTFLTYSMGNFMPQYCVAGTSAGAVGSLYKYDLIALTVTPLGWGLLYYFMPIMLRKPIWSHGLAFVGFCGLAFFYPLIGIHQILYTRFPTNLQYDQVIPSVAFNLVATTLFINFFVTIWGSGRQAIRNLPTRWFYTGMILYLTTCFQFALQISFKFQALIQFSDWAGGHAHLVMFGVFTFWLMGIMTYLFPRLLRCPWYSQSLCECHYWLSMVGVVLMFVDLVLAGILQGESSASLRPWDASIDGSRPFWIIRVFSGLTIFIGQLCFSYNIYCTCKTRIVGDAHLRSAHSITKSGITKRNRQAGPLLVGGVGLLVLAFILNMLMPIYMSQNLHERSVQDLINPNLMYAVEDLSRRFPEQFKRYFGEPTPQAAAEALRLGRDIYVGEGCWHCHSQFVRPDSNDSRRWGPVSERWEYQNALQRPAMFGARRIGPDLSREGGRHSNDWHVTHLFQPTLTSTGSPMPEYAWFFDGAPDKPNKRGLAMVTYLQWLGSWLDVYPYYENYKSIDQLEQAMHDSGGDE